MEPAVTPRTAHRAMTQDTPSKPPSAGVAGAVGARQTAVSFATQVAHIVLGVAATVLLAQALGPAGRGSYAACTVFATLLTVIFFLGTDVGCLFFVGSRRFSVSEGVAHVVCSGLTFAVVAVAVGAVLVRMPWEFFDKASPTAFYVALALVPANFLSLTLLRMLIQVREFTWYGVLSSGRHLLYLGALVVIVWVLDLGVVGAILAMLVSSVLGLVPVLALMRRKYDLRWVWPTRSSLGQVLHYGVRYYFGKVSNLVNMQVGTIVLAMFAPKEDLGFFAVAMSLATRFEMIPGALDSVLFVRVAVDRKGRPDLVARCVRISGVVVGVVLAVAAAVVYPAFRLVLPEFTPSVSVIWILMIGEWARCACKLFVPYFNATDRPGISSIAVVVGVAVNIGLLPVLLPWLGIDGAALAVTASYLVSSAILTFSFWRLSGMGLVEALRPTRADLNMAVGAVRHMLRRKQAEPQPAGEGAASAAGPGEATDDIADVSAGDGAEEP
jgi:O-antigen/teichoic acid export membrane protein